MTASYSLYMKTKKYQTLGLQNGEKLYNSVKKYEFFSFFACEKKERN